MNKTCRLCNQPQPLEAFGFNQQYLTCGERDGRNIYCKPCNRERVAQSRLVVTRKPSVLAPHERVMRAVRRGNRTREAIRRSANLRWDDACDALADLTLEQGMLFIRRIDDEVYFYEKVA